MARKQEVTPARRRAGIALGALIASGALGAGWWAHHGATASSTEHPGAAAAMPALRLAWQVGSAYRYRLSVRADQTTYALKGSEGQGMDASGNTDLALDLVLHAVGRSGASTTFVATIDSVARHHLVALGRPLLDDDRSARENLGAHPFVVAIDGTGRVHAVRFAPDAPSGLRALAPWLVGLTAVTLPEDDAIAWNVAETGPFGASRAAYVRDGLALTRTRTAYDRLDALPPWMTRTVTQVASTTDVKVAPEGHLSSLAETEEVRTLDGAGDLRFEGKMTARVDLVAVGREGEPPPDVARFTEVASLAGAGAEARDQALAERTAGMTTASMLADIAAFANGGVMPDHTRWLWRATGVLARDPKAAAALLAAYRGGGAGEKARALILDLLASSGRPEAQAALREALLDKTTRAAHDRALLVQRASFVSAPERATIETVATLFREGRRDPALRTASAFALGATAGAVAANGDRTTASSVTRELAEAIDGAAPAERPLLVRALGNAGLAEDRARVTEYASDPSPEMRAAAASALRKMDETTTTLIALLGDPSPEVQRAAMGALGGRALGDADIARLAEVVLAGRLDARLDGQLLTMLDAASARPSEVAAIARYVLAREQAEPALRVRARALLERLAA
jgi:hypothetical protein